MLDIKLIRDNPDKVREGLKKRNKDPKIVDNFLTVDEKWRALTKKLDESRFQQNELSKARKIDEAKKLKEEIKSYEAELRKVENDRNSLLENLPNIPADNVPVGKDESENVVIKEVGEKPKFDFKPKEYLEIAEKLDVIDIYRAGKVSGSRFGYLKGEAALLELALIQFAMEKISAKGFIPIIPPVMIKPGPYTGMGRLAGDQKEERYFLEKDNLYLVGSAEHTIGPLHTNEILNEKDLPKRYVGFSTCFRREAGSYGKDTKGILRVHQFDKVEMFSFTKPENSEEEHKFLLSIQEELMQELKLPYRVMQICSGDMGWVDYKQYDLEAWLPGQNQYHETHSCSNTSDFQARGVNTKFGKEGKYVHMLNATGLAIGRIIIAIIENYQTADGGFKIPEILKSRML